MALYVDDATTLKAQFVLDDVPTDPTTIVLVVTRPDLTTLTLNWPTPEDLEHTALGAFEVTMDVDQAGSWRYAFTPTGEVTAVTAGGFEVLERPVLVPITVVDENDDPLPGVQITVFDGETVVAGGLTNAAGIFYASLSEDSEFFLEAEKQGYVTEGAPFTASVTPVDVALELLNIVDFTPTRTILLFGYLQTGGGEAAQGTRVVLEHVGFSSTAFAPGDDPADGVVLANVGTPRTRRELVTDEYGLWFAKVTVGSRVRVRIPSLRVDRFFSVSDDVVTKLNFADVRTDPGTGGELGNVSDIPMFDSIKGVG